MIEVVDRVPTYPGRVRITKENGGASEYVTWERADEPTVEGTPLNKALFDSIRADLGLNESITIYVSPSGSDTLGDGSAANPYATVNKALSVIPKNLNGFEPAVFIAAGTYNEVVVVSRFFGGRIKLTGTVDTTVTLKGLTVEMCDVIVGEFKLSVGTSGIRVAPNGYLYTANSTITVNGAQDGIRLQYNSKINTSRLITINNATSGGLVVESGSTAAIEEINGSGNNIGIVVNSSIAYVRKNSMSATTASVNYNGILNLA